MSPAVKRCAAGLLALAGVLAAAECPAQQHRQIDPARTRPVLSAPATVGGPKTAAPGAGPRFPLVPAGSLATHAAPAAARRPANATATTAPAKPAGNSAAVPRHGGAIAAGPAGRLNPKSSPAAPAKPAAGAAPAPAAVQGASSAAAPAQAAPAGGGSAAPAAAAPAASSLQTTAPQQ